MAIYFVDYENTCARGLSGIQCLTAKDEVVVVTSQNASNISLDIAAVIANSKCKFMVRKYEVHHANACDFRLLTLLLCTVRKNRTCYIISNDQGFDEAIDVARSLGYSRLKRQSAIVVASNAKPAVVVDTDKIKLASFVMSARSLVELHNMCARNWRGDKLAEFYKEGKKLFKERNK